MEPDWDKRIAEDELMHHGIKGQKWGIRRYQNSDGSLTDEGRRRYGYGKGADTIITKNTKQRMKTGTRIGTAIGAATGVVGGLGAYAASLAFGGPAGLAVSTGLTYMTTSTISGALNGLGIGTVVGAIETHKGREYIEKYDKDLEEFEKRDRVFGK